MPELPEVETIRQYLEETVINRPLARLSGSAPTIMGPLRFRISGMRFTETFRHGKYLFAGLDSGSSLVFHFGMTGDLVLVPGEQPDPPYTRAMISFRDRSRLVFTDPRRFGRIGWVSGHEEFIRSKHLGPDALAISERELVHLLDRSSQRMKFLLLDQHKLAGIGNIYADEVLFQAGIHPLREAASLDPEQVIRLVSSVQDVLHTAISLDADVDRYPGTWLIPHRAPGERCPACGGEVSRVMLGGRYTYFCPSCQE